VNDVMAYLKTHISAMYPEKILTDFPMFSSAYSHLCHLITEN